MLQKMWMQPIFRSMFHQANHHHNCKITLLFSVFHQPTILEIAPKNSTIFALTLKSDTDMYMHNWKNGLEVRISTR